MVFRQRQRQQHRRQGLAGAGLGLSSDSALSVTDLALNSSDPGKLLMDLEQNLFEMPTTALWGSLERMRKTLFGGGTVSLTHAMRAFDDCIDGRGKRRRKGSRRTNSGSSSSRRRHRNSNSNSNMEIQRRSEVNDHDHHHEHDSHFNEDDELLPGGDDWFEAAVGGDSYPTHLHPPHQLLTPLSFLPRPCQSMHPLANQYVPPLP